MHGHKNRSDRDHHDRDVKITVTDARGQLGKLLDTHVNDGGVVYLTRNGRRIGAVVAPDVPEKLEALEDDYWSAGQPRSPLGTQQVIKVVLRVDLK
jgi:prevent-host-death family protein